MHRQAAEELANDSHRDRRPDVLEILAVLDELRFDFELAVVAVVVEDAGFVERASRRAARRRPSRRYRGPARSSIEPSVR